MLLKDTALVGVSYVSFLLSPNTHTHTHTHTQACVHTHECEWVKVTQSCLTFCDTMDYTVHGILQARILEWVTFSFSRVSSQPRDRTQVSALQVGSLPAEPQVNTHMRSIYFLWMKLTHKYWTEKRDRKQKEDCQVQPHRASFWGKGKLTPSISLPPTSRQLTFT